MIFNEFIEQNKEIWDAYLNHKFILDLSTSKLDKRAFFDYLKQDYLYLKSYIKVFAILIYKSDEFCDIKFLSNILNAISNTEIDHHINYCVNAGISKQALENVSESLVTISYTRYLLDIANRCDYISGLFCVAACILGYTEAMRNLECKTDDKDYKEWILLYKSDDFQNAAREFEDFLNKKLINLDKNSAKAKELNEIFKTTIMLENGFFSQSIDKFSSK